MLAEDSELVADLGLPESFHWDMCVAEDGKEGPVIPKQKKVCAKCRNGERYVAKKKLIMDHLPLNCRNDVAWQWINHIAELTVKISIVCVSQSKYSSKKTRTILNGTGFVVAVTNVAGDGPDHLASQSTEISIFTAEHVIKSNLVEKIDIFFHFDDEEDSSKRLRVLQGGNVITDIQKDFCQLSCFSSDSEFVRLLDHHLQRVRDISKKFSSSIRFSFIISHPHGWEKQVSFGSWWQHNYDHDDQSIPFKLARFGDSVYGVYKNTVLYNIPTCGGSSGARVMLFGCKDYEYTYHLGSLNDQIGISAYSLKTVEMHEFKRQPMGFGFRSWLEDI